MRLLGFFFFLKFYSCLVNYIPSAVFSPSIPSSPSLYLPSSPDQLLFPFKKKKKWNRTLRDIHRAWTNKAQTLMSWLDVKWYRNQVLPSLPSATQR